MHKVRRLLKRITGSPAKRASLRLAIRQPSRGIRLIARTGSRKWITRFVEGMATYESLQKELQQLGLLQELRDHLESEFAEISGETIRGQPVSDGAIADYQASDIYALVRSMRPKRLVETGVCNGFSTAIILAALHQNSEGHLYSIDFPEYSHGEQDLKSHWQGKGGAVIPGRRQPGWLVPEKFRDRWTFIDGKTDERLPSLLDELQGIDFFLHDSEHSFENQLFEFRLAYNRLSDTGLMLASDISWSHAFDVFWSEVVSESARYFLDYNLVLVERLNEVRDV